MRMRHSACKMVKGSQSHKKIVKKIMSFEDKLVVGNELTVEIEQVFEGGVVVWNRTTGLRGALLQSFWLPVLASPETSLANPLSLVHDHPYADLHHYAKHLAKNIPNSVFLQWHSTCLTNTAGKQTRLPWQRRSKNKLKKEDGSLDQWRGASNKVQSALVEISPPRSLTGVSVSLDTVRSAKVNAARKISTHVSSKKKGSSVATHKCFTSDKLKNKYDSRLSKSDQSGRRRRMCSIGTLPYGQNALPLCFSPCLSVDNLKLSTTTTGHYITTPSSSPSSPSSPSSSSSLVDDKTLNLSFKKKLEFAAEYPKPGHALPVKEFSICLSPIVHNM